MDRRPDSPNRDPRLCALVAACALAIAGAGATTAVGCGGDASRAAVPPPELSWEMGEAQRHARKLGHAIQARNAPLSAFYVEELEETLEAVARDHTEHEGYPIARLIRQLALPALEPVGSAISAGDWSNADEAYAAAIDTCNACHAATEREFVVILPSAGEPIEDQRFARP